MPEQKLIAIVQSEARYLEFQQMNVTHMALHWSIATPSRIQELQDRGIEVWAWTVDDKSIALQLIFNGIDGIITNIPKKMLPLQK